MDNTVRKKKITITVSIVLAIAIVLGAVIIYDWEEDPISIKDLACIAVEITAGTVVLVVANIGLGIKDAYYCIKYNQYWIRHHEKEEIIARYGEFDYYYDNIGYYRTGKISNVSFNAIAIAFNPDGTVKYINMDSSYGYPGG